MSKKPYLWQSVYLVQIGMMRYIHLLRKMDPRQKGAA